MKKLLLFFTALLTAMTAWASTFTVTNSDNTFTVTRSSSSGTETVCYRTVNLTAIAGVHFTEAVGILNFLEGESEKTVTVTETPIDIVPEQYHFQKETYRTYRFEVLDQTGFQLGYKDRDINYGSEYQYNNNFLNKNITDLAFFDDNGNIEWTFGYSFMDVPYNSHDWIKVTDAGYQQGVYTIPTDAIYHGSSALRTYLDHQGIVMYATVYFTQKEEADGYQYIQILADNSTTFDEDDTWGDVHDPSISIYKACFEMTLTGDYSSDEHYQFFPHRYDYVNKDAEIEAGLSHYSFDYDNSYLYKQKFQSPDYKAPNSGSLVLATTVKNLDIRFDAGGNSTDDWDFKNLYVRMALVDTIPVTLLDNYQVSGGLHCKGNTIYVSVPFSETVRLNSSPILSTSWGPLNYVCGEGTNVLTFSGTISDNASGTFSVYGIEGWIWDLVRNVFTGTISHDFDISLNSLYSINYDLAGGILPEGQSNPEAYTELTATFTLNNPTRPGYTFAGWTGSNGETPQTVVTIEQGSEGDRTYTANWDRLDRHYTFDSETGALALLWGEFNKDNKWGDDVDAASVKSVTATREVRFTGDCSNLFAGFSQCDSINLNKVNTRGMTNADHLFAGCSSLTTLDLSGFNTDSVTNMHYMFASCSGLTSLDLSGFYTVNVTDMGFMFAGCSGLTTLDLSGFYTANVTDMSYMFASCSGLISLDLSRFNTANVTNMSCMFAGCPKLTTIYVSEDWSTENVSYSDYMFSACTSLVGGMGTAFDPNHTDKTYAHIDGDTDNPGYLTYRAPRYTFDSETGVLALIRGEFNWDNRWGSEVDAESVTSVTATSEVSFTGNCSSLFEGFRNCDSFDLTNVNTSKMTNAAFMFCNCWSMTSLDLSGFNTDSVTSMNAMFSSCSGLTSLDVSGFNTAKVTSMSGMFAGCSHLTSLDLSGFITDSVTVMSGMFSGNGLLTSLDVSGWNTAKVRGMEYMFNACQSLTSLDLSSWNTANVASMWSMFAACSHLTTIYAGEGWSTENVYSGTTMFTACNNLVGGMGTVFDWSHLNVDYAHIDGGPENPGYFTAKVTAMRGDVNGDDQVKISDVTALINYLLSGDASAINLEAADCNEDCLIKISDVTALINFLLSGQW